MALLHGQGINPRNQLFEWGPNPKVTRNIHIQPRSLFLHIRSAISTGLVPFNEQPL